MNKMAYKLVRMVARQAKISEREALGVIEELFPRTPVATQFKRLQSQREQKLLSEAEYQSEVNKLLPP